MPLAGFPRSGGVKRLAKLCESINSQHFANWIERSRLSRLVSASPAALRIGFHLPVDAMVEFYFENWDAFNCFYASEEFKRLSARGEGFTAPSIHTSCSRIPSSKTPPTAAIGCKVLRPSVVEK